ncbi:semaphorin-5A-like isoform X2 [Crassostrea virginica]
MDVCNFHRLKVLCLILMLGWASEGRRPVEGHWGAWGAWSGCTASCGSGISTRTSSWIMNGVKTQYLFQDIMECSAPEKCPEDGHWGMWTMWGVCPVMCGGGVQKRHRKCDSPAPTYGGRECTGADFDKRLCNNQTCPAIPKNFDPTFCLTDVFICKSAKYCIPRQNECDGKLHCDDGSDEIDCVIVSNFKAPENCGISTITVSAFFPSFLSAIAVTLYYREHYVFGTMYMYVIL